MINRLLKALSKALEILTITCFILLAMMILLQMVGRFISLTGIGWTDEVVSALTSWMVFLGMSYITERSWHVSVTLINDLSKKDISSITRPIIEFINIICGGFVIYSGQLWLKSTATKYTQILHVRYNLWYSAILAFGIFFTIFSILNFVNSFTKQSENNTSSTEGE